MSKLLLGRSSCIFITCFALFSLTSAVAQEYSEGESYYDPYSFYYTSYTSPEICYDGIDNDLDGVYDCGDSDCTYDFNYYYTPSYYYYSPEICSDGSDNDSDGSYDCSDSDCTYDSACQYNYSSYYNYSDYSYYYSYSFYQAEICGDGSDNDNDANTDCQDSDCSSTYECLSAQEYYSDNTTCTTNSIDISQFIDGSNPSNFDLNLLAQYLFDSTNSQDSTIKAQVEQSLDREKTNLAMIGCGYGFSALTRHCKTIRIAYDYVGNYRSEYFVGESLDVLNINAQGTYDCVPNQSPSGASSTDPGNSTPVNNPPAEGPSNPEQPQTPQDNHGEASPTETPYTPEPWPTSEWGSCGDGTDNDLDSAVDCADSDCETDPLCQNYEICNDGADNDNDGAVDCDDSQCALDPACLDMPELCHDGIDNDGDSAVDCNDSDCSWDPSCYHEEQTCTYEEPFNPYNIPLNPDGQPVITWDPQGGGFQFTGGFISTPIGDLDFGDLPDDQKSEIEDILKDLNDGTKPKFCIGGQFTF
jgi:hypothetical protein